ncbi:MAG: hypothetical protein ACQERJ_01595, partial [Bacillota bacterium]
MEFNLKDKLFEGEIDFLQAINYYLLIFLSLGGCLILIRLLFQGFNFSNNEFLTFGLIISLLVVSLPITYFFLKIKLAQLELENKIDYYKNLFKENKLVTLLINPQTGEIKDANDMAVSFYGYSKEQLINKKITEINQLSEEE